MPFYVTLTRVFIIFVITELRDSNRMFEFDEDDYDILIRELYF